MQEKWAALAAQVAGGANVSDGTKVSIFLTDPQGMPAVEAFVEEVYRRGGTPQVLLSDERFDRAAVTYADSEVLGAPAPLEIASLEWADVHISFRAMAAPVPGAVDEKRLALQRRAKGIVSSLRWRHTRWAIVRVPTPDWAALIGCDYEDMMEQFFAGCLDDWERKRTDWKTLADELNLHDHVRITAPDTDLKLGTAGRTWVVFAGEANLPDGELATAPLNDGVNGYITFPGRFWFAGAEIADLRLEFTAGLVSSVSAHRGQRFVEQLLDTDSGSRRVGELGIGTNAALRSMTGDLFLDEKILGTAHIALGRAYPQCGGTNESALHWDIVKDLRVPGGSLEIGDRTLISDGVVVDPALRG